MRNNPAYSIGFYSGISTTLLSIIYIIPQLIIGIEMPSSPADLIMILGPSFLLAPSFLIMMVSIHYTAAPEKKIWSHIGVTFSTAYFVFVTIVYFVGLTIQLPHTLSGDLNKYALLIYEPRSFMTAIDALGYSSMSLAMLFTARIFGKAKLERWLRIAFISTGVLVPIILLTQIYPAIAYLGGFWVLSFPLAASLSIVYFHNGRKIEKIKNSGVEQDIA